MRLILRQQLAAVLLFSFLTFWSLPSAYAQSATGAAPGTSYQKGLAAIEAKLDARRQELGIPGVSLVIVKDDQIIYAKGLGYKDLENKVPVTPDTQFAIGSATKAFTALSVLMSQDEGKLSLSDSPKKYLPYFKMFDPDADQKITVRDLMRHASGLNRTDLAMMTGRLTRAELIQVAAQAKPTAKLGEKFQYQNIMFAAAGEIVAQVQKQPWDKFVASRILAPLGMTNSNLSITNMERSADHSFGYNYNPDTKTTTRLPYRMIDQIAPAGSINSSARDMAQWLRLVLNGGAANGKRLVSEQAFAEWLKPQMDVGAGTSYGYGWFLQKWNGLKVVQHGGNIDGFNSQVAMIPEKKLGFVLLTNVSASPLGGELMPVVWQSLLGDDRPVVTLDSKTLADYAGMYQLAPGVTAEVKLDGDHLTMTVPGQPSYKLDPLGGRKFKPAALPDGFAATFSPDSGAVTALILDQPGRPPSKFQRVDGGSVAAATGAGGPSAASELVGKYESDNNGRVAEIKEQDGKVTFQLPDQPAFTLVQKEKDRYSLVPLPADAYSLIVNRDAAGKVQRLTVKQPEGEFGFKNLGYAGAGLGITTDDLMKKVIDAEGGETAMRRVTSRVASFNIDFIHQGVQGHGTSWSKAPNKAASETTITALGKTIALEYDYFDGTAGQDATTLGPSEPYTGRRLADVRRSAELYPELQWKDAFSKIEITRVAKVGDEECYAVAFTPKEGTKFTEYYSKNSFLLLKREGVQIASALNIELPYSIMFSDYRDVDGVKIPFKTVSNSVSNGDVITTITSVKQNVTLDDKLFTPKKLKL